MDHPEPHEHTPRYTHAIHEQDEDYYEYDLVLSADLSHLNQVKDRELDEKEAGDVLHQIASADLSDDSYCRQLNAENPGLQPINRQRAELEDAKVINPEDEWWVMKIRLE